MPETVALVGLGLIGSSIARGARTYGLAQTIVAVDRDPAVLVIGGGQAGLAIAARLTALGIDALIVDREARVGDNWRQRYHALVLHNQVQVNHLPYMPFPKTWPTYIPKDKLANWLEAYAEAMELNVWTGTEFVGGRYDEAERRWSLTVRSGETGAGRFGLYVSGNYLLKYSERTPATTGFVSTDYVGTERGSPDQTYPHFKGLGTIDWSVGPVTASVTGRYIDNVDEIAAENALKSRLYGDVQLQFRPAWLDSKLALTFGVMPPSAFSAF